VISIESNLVGLVIGRGGDNLKRIEKETGARIQFITGPQHNGPQRDCRLSGEARNRHDAKHMIWRILEENGGHATAMRTSQVVPKQRSSTPPRQANQPKLREGENSVQIMVPDKTVGLIIGRGGETIRDLQEKSACHINIVGENKSVNGLRPVNLIGSEEAATLARQLILEIVDSDTRDQLAAQAQAQAQAAGGRPPQQERRPPMGGMGGGPDKVTEMIHVPSEAVGMIIGKGGETIKQMQADTGCKINVQQASGRDVERPIELVGEYGAIERAKTALWDKVEQVVSVRDIAFDFLS
jgi:far upstream element-binding protein